MKKPILSALFVLSFVFCTMAQNAFTDKANKYYESQNYYEAIDHYKKAYSKEKNKASKAEILFKIGMCYTKIADTKNAEAWFAKAVKVKYKNPEVYLYYGEALKANGLYSDAIAQFNQYKQEVPNDPRGEEGAKACETAQAWKDKPGRYKIDNFSAANSKNSDFSASYSAKSYNGIIFTSSREEAMGKDYDASWSGEKNTDLFEVTSDKKGKWSTPVSLPAPVNTENKEGGSSLDRKFSDMYFTRCEEGKTKVVTCKIYQTKRSGPAVWSDALMVPFCAADSSTYGHPSVSADESTLYFSSDREGGQGGKDIWMSAWDKKEKVWGAPVNLGAPVNTSKDQLFPFIHADGTLYFSSTGHQAEGNMGGLDIFSAKNSGGKFGEVKNLKPPINSNADDYAIIWEDTDKKGYFTSNREGGKGKDDIYSFILPPLIFTLQGKVIDVDSRKAIQDAKVELFNNVDGTSISYLTDAAGFYKFTLASNTSYKLAASKKEYLGAKGEESTVGIEESKDFFRDFELKTTKKEIVLPNIFYDLNQATLRPESKIALDGLVETLKDNPTIVVEMGAHTDTRATDEYNDKLSQARAQSVVDYLISKGIEVGRLVPRGYGEKIARVLQNDEKVIVDGKDVVFKSATTVTDQFITTLKSKEEQEAAHQLNRRTEFKVLRDDYVPGSSPSQPSDLKLEDQKPKEIIADTPKEEPKKEEPKKEEPKKVEPKKEEAPAKEKFYTSIKGDTYASIAVQFNMSEEDFKTLNNASGKKPKEGTVLRIVDENEYHNVVKGDTYGKIAKQYNIKLTELKKMNNISDEPIVNYKKLIIKNNNTPPPTN